MDFCKPRAYKSVSSSEMIEKNEERLEGQKQRQDEVEVEEREYISLIQRFKNLLF